MQALIVCQKASGVKPKLCRRWFDAKQRVVAPAGEGDVDFRFPSNYFATGPAITLVAGEQARDNAIAAPASNDPGLGRFLAKSRSIRLYPTPNTAGALRRRARPPVCLRAGVRLDSAWKQYYPANRLIMAIS
jgi:hypothetical protein